jgi:hypothetical protein
VILYKKAGLRIAELWFDEQPNGACVDVLRHRQRSAPTAEGTSTPFHTILIDLKHDPDLLLARVKRDTRYEIRRARSRDNLTYQLCTTVGPELLDQFKSAYIQFARQKGLSVRISVRLERLAEIGELSLSLVRTQDGLPLVWHAYYRANDRVRLLHSVSLVGDCDSSRRTLLGRANRYHHWEDLLAFRSQGVGIYDLGGWYGGRSDEKKLSINKFKEEFGGEIVLNYNCQHGLTLAGRTAVWLYARFGPERLS